MRLLRRAIPEANVREREALAVLVALADEFPGQPIAREAIEHVLGEPCPGSLAGLVMLELAEYTEAGGKTYRPTERGTALARTATKTQIVVPPA